MSILRDIRAVGQQIWLDNLSRALINDGELAALIGKGLSGVTTNPAIFQKAISGGLYYGDDLAALKKQDLSAERRYELLVIPDVQRACDLMRPVFDESKGDAGYVSLEVSPTLAHDEEGTVAAARRLHAEVARDNVLIKIPATAAGLKAISRAIGEGISINVTLMFSLSDVDGVAEAYISGLEALAAKGGDISKVKSVASLFLSRSDTAIDAKLDAAGGDALALRGKTAVALAKLAYARWQEIFGSPRFAALKAKGARVQPMLWASTGTKNPAFPDLLYVEPLVGPDTVNTLPDGTLAALLDHGKVSGNTLVEGVAQARAHFEALKGAGIDVKEVGANLQKDGLTQFDQAFAKLLEVTA
ncbi:transaldolase [Niveibacterium sp. SC-1]|uniref:transaldolase n=1 Tax=Niveibacterium sp. SC-1 TaxID=3135646 RepID=UPI00311FE599